jgi:hypothetical protein
MNWFRLILNTFAFRFFFLFFGTSFVLMAMDPNKTITQYRVQVWDMGAGLPGNSVYPFQA